MTMSDVRPYLFETFELDLSMLVTFVPAPETMNLPLKEFEESESY